MTLFLKMSVILSSTKMCKMVVLYILYGHVFIINKNAAKRETMSLFSCQNKNNMIQVLRKDNYKKKGIRVRYLQVGHTISVTINIRSVIIKYSK